MRNILGAKGGERIGKWGQKQTGQIYNLSTSSNIATSINYRVMMWEKRGARTVGVKCFRQKKTEKFGNSRR